MRSAIALVLLAPALALAAPGDLDPTFGNGGTVLSVPADGAGLVVQPTGRIVAAAARQVESAFGASELTLVGLRPDGTLDPTFGSAGIVADHLPAGAVALAADGGLLVAGADCTAGACTGTLRRYDANGRLDTAFGGGHVGIDAGTPTFPQVVVTQPDGRILVGGNSGHSPFWFVWIARFEADGTPDRSFASNGLFTDFISPHAASLPSLLVEPDGSIVASETGGAIEGAFSRVVRFTANGTEITEPSVDDNGIVLARSPDGSVVAAGVLQNPDMPIAQIRLERFTASLASSDVLATVPQGSPTDLVVQPDGKPVVSAVLVDEAGTVHRFAVLRFTADGTLDAAFGDDGLVTPFASTNAAALNVALQPDGKLLAAGVVDSTLAVVRLLGDETTAVTTTTTPRGVGRTTTTTPAAGGTSTTRPPPTCATGCDDGDACTTDQCRDGACVNEPLAGLDAVTCRCDEAMPACSDRRLRRLAVRSTRACKLLHAAARATSRRAQKLEARAAGILERADRRARALAAHRSVSCVSDVVGRIGDLDRRAAALVR